MKRPEMDTTPKFVSHFQIQTSRQEILRLLGAGAREARLGEKTLSMLLEAETFSGKLLRPQGVYRILENPRQEGLNYLGEHHLIGLGLCTIGPELEGRVKELMTTGREPEGFILDALGSVAAEAAADQVNARICQWAAAQGLVATPRFSPGYGNWPLEDQRIMFRLLPAEQIGMRLNQACMMTPRKSISFAVTFQKEAAGQKIEHPCERCGLENCPFRKK